jgi:DNA-binding NtrC family response regulator
VGAASAVGIEVLAFARLLIDSCHFDRAEALISGVAVLARVENRTVPSAAHDLWANLCFWTGRFEEAARLIAETEALRSADASTVLGGLMAWWRMRGSDLVRLAGTRGGAPVVVRRLLAFLTATLARDSRGVSPALDALVRAARAEPSSSTVMLARLVGAEACLTSGLRDEATDMLGPPTMWECVPRVYRLAHDWLETRAGGNHDGQRALETKIRRLGATGITRWGWGRMGMPWLHALPSLLQTVNEAEDELSALRGGCQWMATECGAEASAFLDVEDATTVAGTSSARLEFTDVERRAAIDAASPAVTTRPDGVLVSAPVRYAGAKIGALIASGPSDRLTTLSEACASLAALCAPAMRTRIDTLALRRHSHERIPEIVGTSAAMAALRDTIARAAASSFAVLIEGESGSGKELVARAVHRLSARRERRFAALNCAALSDELAESELFGHSRGAFTGAVGPRIGLIEEAHAGTLFLDEVGELSARAQAKLLRALQEREVRRVGENAPRPVDVRVIAATNRSLRALVAASAFREDLLFRLAVVHIRVPPLRDRLEDVPLLVQSFWNAARKGAETRAVLGADALRRLVQHGWPGNVRELQNVMAALVVIAPSRGRISARHVNQVLAESGGAAASPPSSLDRGRTEYERHIVTTALARNAGRRTAAARELGLTRQGLAKAIKRLHVDAPASMAGVA